MVGRSDKHGVMWASGRARLLHRAPTAACPGDADGDGDIDITDLGFVLAQFGMVGPGLEGDLDGDGDVDVTDLGIVLGNKHYALAVVGTVTVLIVLTVLNRLTHFIHPVIYRRLLVVHHRDEALDVATEVTALLKQEKCQVLDLSSSHDAVDRKHELVFYVMLKNGLRSPRVTQLTAGLEGVSSARWKRY